MKRAVAHHRGLFLLAGILLVLAGIAWGATLRPRAVPLHAAPAVSAVQSQPVNSPPAVAVAAPRVAPALSTIQAPSVTGQGGMRIFRDPETGQIGPPPPGAVVRAEQSASQDVSNLPHVINADGSVTVDLQGRFQETMIIQLDANGKRVVRCLTDPKAALQRAPVPAPSRTPQREDK